MYNESSICLIHNLIKDWPEDSLKIALSSLVIAIFAKKRLNGDSKDTPSNGA